MKKETQKEKVEVNSPSEILSYIKPKNTVQINGKLIYRESLHAWNTIYLQREMLDVFPVLREKRGNFGYKMYYNRSFKEVKKIMDELEKHDLVPILLLLGKVKENVR